MLNLNEVVIDRIQTSKRIRHLMEENALSVKDLMEILYLVRQDSIYKWLRGDQLPSLDQLYALSQIFHTDIEDILVWEDVADD